MVNLFLQDSNRCHKNQPLFVSCLDVSMSPRGQSWRKMHISPCANGETNAALFALRALRWDRLCETGVISRTGVFEPEPLNSGWHERTLQVQKDILRVYMRLDEDL